MRSQQRWQFCKPLTSADIYRPWAAIKVCRLRGGTVSGPAVDNQTITGHEHLQGAGLCKGLLEREEWMGPKWMQSDS